MWSRGHRSLVAVTLAGLAALAGCGSAEPAPTSGEPATTVGPTAPPETSITGAPPTTIETTTTAPAASGVIVVPAGATPTIDGTLDDVAWEGAAVTEVGDGMTLLWLSADGILYVGVRYDRVGAVNLLIAEDDRIRILHASAALGSATHVREEGNSWSLAADYTWCCRNPASTSQRDALWEEEGWLASLGGVGAPGEVEYAVALADGVHVALSWVAGGDVGVLWPGDLPEAEAEALTGPRLAEETFDPGHWFRLELEA